MRTFAFSRPLAALVSSSALKIVPPIQVHVSASKNIRLPLLFVKFSGYWPQFGIHRAILPGRKQKRWAIDTLNCPSGNAGSTVEHKPAYYASRVGVCNILGRPLQGAPLNLNPLSISVSESRRMLQRHLPSSVPAAVPIRLLCVNRSLPSDPAEYRSASGRPPAPHPPSRSRVCWLR